MEEDYEAENKEFIVIDDSFLDIKDDIVTFSVNKVDDKAIYNQISGKEAFKETMDKLKEQLQFEFKLQSANSPYKSSNKASAEGKLMLTTKAIFPIGSQKISQISAIYGSPTKYTKGFSPTKEFGGLGKFQDYSLKHDNNENSIFINTGFPSSVSAVHYAYAYHQHLALSPSDFVIMIGQGLSTHINMNAEKLRHNFVEHEGQKSLVVINDKLDVNGKGDWTEVFGQFAEEIKKSVKKDVYSVIIDDLNTATKTTRIVSEMTLMDSMKNYFKYESWAGCGFPKITLKGTPDDWKKFQEKVYILRDMNKGDTLELEWWLRHLVPITDKICEAGIERKIDRKFWGNICQSVEEYGELTTGWINAFAPYIYTQQDGHLKNYALKAKLKDDFTFTDGVDSFKYSEGITKVPFMFKDKMHLKHNMHCYSGFLGAKYDKEKGWIEPGYFWSVYEDPKK